MREKHNYEAMYKEYREDRVSMKYLGNKYGVTRQAISKAWKRLGLKARKFTYMDNSLTQRGK